MIQGLLAFSCNKFLSLEVCQQYRGVFQCVSNIYIFDALNFCWYTIICLFTKYENSLQVCSLVACHLIETINLNIHNGVKLFIYTYCCSFILACSSISFFFFSQPKAAPDLNAVSYFCKATASSHGNESSKLSSVSL